MSDTFTASNGVEVEVAPEGHLLMPPAAIGLGEESQQALREFFQHERDKELGRWRFDRGSRGYVVYPKVNGSVRVVEEITGQSEVVTREIVQEDPDSWPSEVADAYFAAHPGPKPWHDAKPGEVWIITTENVADEVAVQVTPEGTFQYNDAATWLIRDMPIVSARRIFPEVTP